MDPIETRLADLARVAMRAGIERTHGAVPAIVDADQILFSLPLSFDDPRHAQSALARAEARVVRDANPVFDNIDAQDLMGSDIDTTAARIAARPERYMGAMATARAAYEFAMHAATVAELYRHQPGTVNTQDLARALDGCEMRMARVAQLIELDMDPPDPFLGAADERAPEPALPTP